MITIGISVMKSTIFVGICTKHSDIWLLLALLGELHAAAGPTGLARGSDAQCA